MECLDLDKVEDSRLEFLRKSNCTETCSILHEFYMKQSKTISVSPETPQIQSGLHNAVLAEHKSITKLGKDKLLYTEDLRRKKKLYALASKHSLYEFFEVGVSEAPGVLFIYIENLLTKTHPSKLCSLFNIKCCFSKVHCKRCALKWKSLLTIFQDLRQDDDLSLIHI